MDINELFEQALAEMDDNENNLDTPVSCNVWDCEAWREMNDFEMSELL